MKTQPQGLDLHWVRVVVQYHLPKNIDAIIQHFGHAGCNSSIQAIAILLVEKTYFSKPGLEHWASMFEDAPSATPTK